MKRSAMFAIVLAIGWTTGWSTGCTTVGNTFTCESDSQCGLGSLAGHCETTGFCSLPSSDCPLGGNKYDKSAGAGLAGSCVGGAGDGGMGDGGGDGGTKSDGGSTPPSLCASLTGTGTYCQSFESDVDLPWTDFTMGTNTTFERQTSRVYRGANAAHLHVPATSSGDQVGAQLDLPSMMYSTSPDVYVRGFYYIEAAPPVAVPILSIQQSKSPMHQHSAWILPDGTLESVDSIISSGDASAMSTPFPMNAWVCVTLHVQFATSGEMDVKVNDVAQPKLTLTGNTSSTVVADLMASGPYIIATSSLGTWDLWMDEVAVSTSPITCAQ